MVHCEMVKATKSKALTSFSFILATAPSASRNLLSSHNSSFHRSTESRLTTMISPPPANANVTVMGGNNAAAVPTSPGGSDDEGGFGGGGTLLHNGTISGSYISPRTSHVNLNFKIHRATFADFAKFCCRIVPVSMKVAVGFRRVK